MYVATASPQHKRTAFDGSRGGNVPCVPPPPLGSATEPRQQQNLVSRASRIFLYFRWEEREGEKNTSGHSGQLPVDIRTNHEVQI